MTLAIALKKTTSNLNHFLPPHYYEVSKSSYSEQYSAYNTLILTQCLSQKMQQLDICKQKANERLFKKTGKKIICKSGELHRCFDSMRIYQETACKFL